MIIKKGLGTIIMVAAPPETKRNIPRPETATRRSGGWLRRLGQRVKLAFGGDDNELVVKNQTSISWRVYQDYHELGIVDSGEERTFRLEKYGMLNVRPFTVGGSAEKEVEYLVLQLAPRIRRVRIYRRQISAEIEVYEMRAA